MTTRKARTSAAPRIRPPRPPRGEKPSTTIRLLNRQVHGLTGIIDHLRLSISDKEKVIAGYDVQLSEANDLLKMAEHRNEWQAGTIARLTGELRVMERRVEYLEGYHAKSQEFVAARTKPEVFPGAGFGDARRATLAQTYAESEGREGSAEGHARTARGALRLQQEISETLAGRDPATVSDLPSPAAKSRQHHAGIQGEAGFDTRLPTGGLTPEEHRDLDQMERDADADRERIQPRTPYRGTDGPLL